MIVGYREHGTVYTAIHIAIAISVLVNFLGIFHFRVASLTVAAMDALCTYGYTGGTGQYTPLGVMKMARLYRLPAFLK